MSEDAAAEPSAESLIDQSSNEGWNFFGHDADPQKAPPAQELNQREKRVAMICAVLMQTDEFKELVEFLLDKTLRRATFTAALGLKMDEAYGFGVHREGQNSIVFMLMKMIAEGRRQIAPKGRDT